MDGEAPGHSCIFTWKGDYLVQEAAVSSLTDWANFYVIIGSSAGALTGLMFVVITLTAGAQLRAGSAPIAAFNTPTVVHFCLALLVAAILSAPWQGLALAATLLGLTGLGGIAYIVIVLRRLRRQTLYEPVLEDWLWHVLLPLTAYTVLAVAGIMLAINPVLALFGIGGATVLLVFIGIHNAWDNVTYIATELLPRSQAEKDE